MKLVFMGTPAFAAPSLTALSDAGAHIVAVYTKEPKQAGRRGLELTKTPVHQLAEQLGLRVETPKSLRNPQAQRTLAELRPDIAVVAAYGLLLPAEVLALFPHGCFNLHASLLPRWRGAAPVQRAIMAGDAETGVALMRMEVGLDTGPIAGELRATIDPQENSAELTARLGRLAAKTLQDNWRALSAGELVFRPQETDGVEYARKIEKSESPIDWSAAAARVRRHVHGLAPFPGATAELSARGAGERLKFLRVEIAEGHARPGEILDDRMTVACGEGAVRVLQVQRQGRNAVTGEAFMRSGLAKVGDVLTSRI